MDKKRLLELAGVQLNEQHPTQEFCGYSMSRDSIAETLNYYYLDEEGYGTAEMRAAIPRFTPNDERLTDEACKTFVTAIADIGMEAAMGDRAPDTVEDAMRFAFPKLARRLAVAKKRQR